MVDGSRTFEVKKPTSWRALVVLMVAWLGIGLGSLAFAVGEEGFDRLELLLGGIGVLALGWIPVLLYFKRMSHVGPELLIDRQGVSLYGVGLVPWEEITGLVLRRIYGQEVVAFKVRGRQRALARGSVGHKVDAWLNERFFGFTFSIVPKAVDSTTDTLVEIVRGFRNLPVDDRR